MVSLFDRRNLKMSKMESTHRFVSCNLHGFRQGQYCLAELCADNDIILVQEHWLTTDDLDQLSVSDDLTTYASSSMDNAISTGVLRGRPYVVWGFCCVKHLQLALNW